LKKLEQQIKEKQQSVDDKIGVKVRVTVRKSPGDEWDGNVQLTVFHLPAGIRHRTRTTPSLGCRR